MQRRHFLRLLGGSLLLPGSLNAITAFAGEKSRTAFLSAQDNFQGQHFITGFDHIGQKTYSLEVPSRAHGMAKNPANNHQVVYASRRPGTELYSVSLDQATITHRISSSENRHFYGHAFFTRDGRYLLTCENNYAEGTGVIVIRDAVNLQALQEYSSYGIGPHEIHLLADGKTLVIANGGILTHPDSPRVKLNLKTMQPSLTYIDLDNGDLLGEYRLANNHLGIRHIDVNHDDRVMLAMQYEGKDYQGAMVAAHHGEDQLQLFTDSHYDWGGLNHYCGSVTYNENSDIAAVTSPRGNKFMLCNSASGEIIHSINIRDVCGVAFDRKHNAFIATNGAGSVYRVSMDSGDINVEKLATAANTRWDNHLLAI